MKFSKGKLLVLTLALLGLAGNLISKSAVTYSFSGGRFGDNLMAYSHARYVAYKYGCSFLYRPFHYSDQLSMHTMHEMYQGSDKYKDIITYPKHHKGTLQLADLRINKNENNLYVIRYFSECKEANLRLKMWHFDVDWNDKEFIHLLKKEIAPAFPLQKLSLPKHVVTVAVHIRRGGTYDKLYQTVKRSSIQNESQPLALTLPTDSFYYSDHTVNADKRNPLKFPPDSFYIEHIKKVSTLFKDAPLYVHLFH